MTSCRAGFNFELGKKKEHPVFKTHPGDKTKKAHPVHDEHPGKGKGKDKKKKKK
jgi:hypothetical protein